MARGLDRMMRDAEAWEEVVQLAARFKDEEAHLQHLTEQLEQLRYSLGDEWIERAPGEWIGKRGNHDRCS